MPKSERIRLISQAAQQRQRLRYAGRSRRGGGDEAVTVARACVKEGGQWLHRICNRSEASLLFCMRRHDMHACFKTFVNAAGRQSRRQEKKR